MTAQVVTPENQVEFLTTGKVPEFKPPEAAKDAGKETAKANGTTTDTDKAATASTEAKADDASKTEQPRGEDGKFKAEAKADGADDEDAQLSEKIRKIIGKKHRQMMEAQEFATGEGRKAIAAERRVAELEAEIKALRGGKADGSAGEGEGSDPDEPKPSDFKTVGEYTRALVKYEAKKAGEAGRAQAEQNRQKGEADEAVASFAQRQEAFKKSAPDYEEVIGDCDLELHNVGMQYLVESESGPALAYHLAKNPDEITRLKKLSPTRVLAELGKLEAKLEKSAAPKPAAAASSPETSRAPAPIQPLEGKQATVETDPSKMNFQQLRAHRLQEAQKRAAR